jgi:hypothetical protein
MADGRHVVEELRQVAVAWLGLHPDRHRPVTRVVGEYDQETAGVEAAVRQPAGPGLGVRDTNGGHRRSSGATATGIRFHTL